jgi:gamma-glutamyltranspeptidase/glutathione hydrolase
MQRRRIGQFDHGDGNTLHNHFIRSFAVTAALSLLTACGLGSKLSGSGPDTQLGQTATAPSAFGYAVADEPQAALVARQILNNGGNAADAAAAAGFAMSVTLPSRAGLGGGGACIIKVPDAKGNPQPAVALLFPPGAPAASGGDRPAAVPTMARGLLALEARYGTLPVASIIVPAERLAGGVPVSPALEADLTVVGSALLADPGADAVFGTPSGGLLPAGANLSQPDLVATLEVLRTQGVQGFYQGAFASQFAAAADQAGANLSAADLNDTLPQFVNPILATLGSYQLAGLPYDDTAGSKILPASAGFAALDKNGGVVACVVTMNNLFGTGRIAPGTGILLAASPKTVPTPLLRAAIAYTPGSGNFRAAVTGTGQQDAPTAASQGLYDALNNTTAPVTDPGRANIISCPGGVPGGEATCTATADPRGQGLAVGGR